MTSISLNVTQHTLESARSTAPSDHREHMTNLIVATLLMIQPRLVVVTTSAATSSGSEARRLNVEELATHAPGLLHWRLCKTVEFAKSCAIVDISHARSTSAAAVAATFLSRRADHLHYASDSIDSRQAFESARQRSSERPRGAEFRGPAGPGPLTKSLKIRDATPCL